MAVPGGGVGLEFPNNIVETAFNPNAPKIPPAFNSTNLVGLDINPSVPGLADAIIGINGLYILVSLNGCNPCNNN